MYKNVICKQQLYVAINLSVNKRPNNIYVHKHYVSIPIYRHMCIYICTNLIIENHVKVGWRGNLKEQPNIAC